MCSSDLELQPHDLGVSMQAWSAEIEAQAAARSITFQLEGVENPGRVAFHAGTLRRAVLNLLQNALDAMPDGGKLTVCTTAVQHEKPVTGYVQLTVGDTGVGIPQEIASKVFDLKFTTKSERNRGEGLGLGLWWVRNFVRRAKGDITIRSEPGVGTEVYVKIPTGPASG